MPPVDPPRLAVENAAEPFLTRVDRLLGDYTPVDAREAGFRRRMLELARMTGACGRRHMSPGHFTASAFVLSPDYDEVLLIFHKKLGRWLQPGGHVDAGDASPMDT